jgi:hypothetical protein
VGESSRSRANKESSVVGAGRGGEEEERRRGGSTSKIITKIEESGQPSVPVEGRAPDVEAADVDDGEDEAAEDAGQTGKVGTAFDRPGRRLHWPIIGRAESDSLFYLGPRSRRNRGTGPWPRERGTGATPSLSGDRPRLSPPPYHPQPEPSYAH